MKKSNLVAIILIVVAGAFGIALMTHLANTAQQPPKNQSAKTENKPQVAKTRPANSDPALIDIVNKIRTNKDLAKPIDDFEIVFYTQADHDANPNLQITTFPKSDTEPFIVKVPLGIGIGVDEGIAKAFIQYRQSQDPSLHDSDIIDRSKLSFNS